MRFATIAACIGLLAGCRVSEQHTTSADNRIFPPGEGKVVQFDLQSPDDAPVYLVSKNVQAQRSGSSVVVNFDEIDFSRGPKEQRDIKLKKMTVRAYRPSAEGHGDLIASAEEKLSDVELSDKRPAGRTSSIQMTLSNAAQDCNGGCFVAVAIDYSASAAKASYLGGLFHAEVSQIASTESLPVRLNLATGNAGEPAAVAEAGDDAARVANCSPQSHFGPAAATRALGVPIKYYASEPTDCTMMPVDDRQGWFFFGVMDYAPFCEDMRRNETAVETVQLGDAAIWVSSRSTLCVQRGGQAIDVEVKEPDKSLAKKKAIDIATKILAAL